MKRDEIPRDERAVSDADFLRALDPKRRDLAGIRRAAEAGDIDGARRGLVEHFRTRQRPAWFFDFRDGRRGKVVAAWPGIEQGDRWRADPLLRNRFHLREDNPALVWDFGEKLRWHTAEMRQLGSTPYRLKRGNFFRDLAMAYGETGRAAYAVKFAAFAERWRKDWPLVVDDAFHPDTALLSRPDGQDTMTMAYRWMAWMDCLYGGIAFAPEVPTETTFGLIKSLWFIALQYRHYEKSVYTPANHHLFERGTAPFLCGIMLPEFPEVARLVEQARPVIARHVARSFLLDGGYEERSPAHAVVALHMFLIPLRLAGLNRVRMLGRGEEALIRRCGEMVALLALPDGSQPDIGDGRYLASDTVRVLGDLGAILKSRASAEVLRRLRLNNQVEAKDRPALKRVGRQALPLTASYPSAGFFVSRDGWTPRASAMALSVPGTGLPNHAHDDALSLQLIVRGEPMIGTPISELYSYLNRNRQAQKRLIRGHFYAMTSHNVVLVGGEPLRSPASLASSWGPAPTPVQTEWEEGDDGVRVASSHEGYPGVRLSREVVFRHGKGWVVRDRVEGSARKPHVARWHFEYGVEVVEQEGLLVATRGQARLRIGLSSQGKVRARLYRDRKWLGKNPLRPEEAAPWVLDVRFGGSGDDLLETRFDILSKRGK